jgi:thymidylate synthase
MRAYLEIVDEIFTRGKLKHNRTGVDTIAIEGATFRHDMSKGFPLLTTKKIKFENVASELEFFIKGITDKKWLRDRGNPIWNDWRSSQNYDYNIDESMLREYKDRELGPIYGFNWRHFGAKYEGFDKDYLGKGFDQLEYVIKLLKIDPNSRRMYVSAWNPAQINEMALPPCHYGFYINVLENKLNLTWDQRSVDTAIGLPFNIASYATLLHLLAKESKFEEGILTGSLKDVHIYLNHISRLKEQLRRKLSDLPKIITENFTSIFDWSYTDSKIVDYYPQEFIKFEIAV